jgi:phage-related protein
MLLWKNIDFRNKGIIVEETPKISKGKKNIDIYTIPGRSGFLSIDNGTYDSFVISVSCHFNENANFDEIKEYLDGYGTISLDGQREYTGIIQNSISFEKVLMFKKFVVQFLVNPIAEDINSTTYNVESSSDILTISGATAEINPIVEITGSGDATITINNKSFVLYDMDGKFILDCKSKVITKDGINVSNKMQYDFPKLYNGENTIDYVGNISEFKIIYKKAYL